MPRPDKKLPDEPRRLALVLCGVRQQEFWGDTPGTPPQALDFFDIKGIVEALLADLHTVQADGGRARRVRGLAAGARGQPPRGRGIAGAAGLGPQARRHLRRAAQPLCRYHGDPSLGRQSRTAPRGVLQNMQRGQSAIMTLPQFGHGISPEHLGTIAAAMLPHATGTPKSQTRAVAQVGAIMILSKPENRERLIFFMGIERVRYRRPVHPGDVVEIEAIVRRVRSRMGVLHGIARVDGHVAVEGTMTFALGPRKDQPAD